MDKILIEDVDLVANLGFPWDKLKNKSVLITGASGMIGSFLVDVLMRKNQQDHLNCQIYAMGRSAARAQKRFFSHWNQPEFHFLGHDINASLDGKTEMCFDYILHLASNTHPVAYATDPIGTITTNVLGTHYLLQYAVSHKATRFLLASSCEIYGENRGDTELFDEAYCGYINSNTLRAGYPESKRCAETLCQAFWKQTGIDVVIARLARSYGPTLLETDTKALSQFLHKGIAGENIVLKSEGTQFFSYTYVADAVSGLLTVLLLGESGGAYNVADVSCDIMLKDLAQIVADCAGTRVVFDLPDAVEKAGFSKATKSRLDGTKLRALGWCTNYDIKAGIERTMACLKNTI